MNLPIGTGLVYSNVSLSRNNANNSNTHFLASGVHELVVRPPVQAIEARVRWVLFEEIIRVVYISAIDARIGEGEGVGI